MESLKETLKKITNEIHKISDLIYQQKLLEAFQQFSILLNELTIITDQVFALHNRGELEGFDENLYLKTLTEAMSALESRDDVLLADVLNYDLLEQIEKIIKQL